MRVLSLTLAIVWSCAAAALADSDNDYFAPPMSDAPAGTQWNNPFCDAAAVVVGWDLPTNQPYGGLTRTYALYVWGHATSDYAARVTLVGDGEAYSVDVPRVAASAAGISAVSAYLVMLPAAVRIDRYFVDGVGVNGAPVTDCPSYVKAVFAPSEMGGSLPADRPPVTPLAARELQRLSAPACGMVYRKLEQRHSFQPLVGFFGNRPLTAEVEVFVDSSGQVVSRKIWRSSGVEGIDDAALSAVQWTTYRPAEFLCTPVVSSGIYAEEYKP